MISSLLKETFERSKSIQYLLFSKLLHLHLHFINSSNKSKLEKMCVRRIRLIRGKEGVKVAHLTAVGAISRVSPGGAIKGKSIFRHVYGGILYTCTRAYLFRPDCQSSRLESFGHAWEDTRIRLSHRGFSIKFTGTP